MADTILGGTIGFLDQIGVYDVVLPFLLVFTIVFAILEKTKVFGEEEFDGKKYTKKNLNAMVSFVIGFFVIASANLVEIITNVSSNMIILMLLAVFFMVLVGIFYSNQEEFKLSTGWKALFTAVMFIGILLIFLNALKTEAGDTYLEIGFEWLSQFYTSAAVGTVILIGGIIAFIYYITSSDKPKEKKD